MSARCSATPPAGLTRSRAGCKTVSAEVLTAAVEAPRLLHLDCAWVNAISEKLADEAAARRPGLRITDYYGTVSGTEK